MPLSLSEHDKARYEWQMWLEGFGEEGQQKLKNASVLISRAGGLGGVVALELAAAGIGKMVVAHAGDLKPSDLNRQLLMSHDALGTPRAGCIEQTLLALKPDLDLLVVPENINEKNVDSLVREVDLVIDCAPLFEERFLMGQAAFDQKKPVIECAMFGFEASITTLIPGKTGCLRCLFPEKPQAWKRQFPVLGAVSGTVGCLAATEAVKYFTGIGNLLLNEMLVYDLKNMSFDKMPVGKNPECQFCG